MVYTVGEMAKRLGVAPSTLRFYDKEGLLPFVERSEGGIRLFKDADFEWLRIIECLKKTGMPLKDIKEFIMMAMAGDDTIEDRLALIQKQRESVEQKIQELTEIHQVLRFKQWYYETAKTEGTTSVPRSMALEELPEEFREVRKQLRGE
ncbi:MAG: MerR family transcriptional regulator [Ruminiclostridium sp.]|nr:MerR family transcriptional regulator [Ruminiclostridium sp.]MBQ9852682.1 MerR family transcriptional regulator [Ruminiclostridium sp.]